ncbi:MAG: radical SAM protein [Lachnospiraceae bacterium]|nr:radical SAM protein [Lachnospiraceae bacterium]
MTLNEYTASLFKKSAAKGVPLSGTFELTARCNLDCRMCYVHRREKDAEAGRQELTAAEWLKIAGEAAESGTLFLLLTGGEPLLRPDFAEIYRGCRRLGLAVSINTNGTLIDGRIADLFASLPPVRVNLSLYGSGAQTYGTLCGHPDAYARAVNGIRLLRERNVPFRLNFTASALNAADAEAVARFAGENGVPVQTTSYLFPPLRVCGTDAHGEERLSPEEAAKVRFGHEKRRFSSDELTKRIKAILSGQLREAPERERGRLISCRAGESSYWITFSGEMRPCGMAHRPSVAVKDGFSEAWNEIRRARDELMIPEKCAGCPKRPVCEICPASCYAETGGYDLPPEYLCRMTDAFLSLCAAYVSENQQKGNLDETQ